MEAERYAKLGRKWTCYSCAGKFYDLQKPEAICPSCNADQAARPPEEPPVPKKKKATRKKPARKTTRAKAS